MCTPEIDTTDADNFRTGDRVDRVLALAKPATGNQPNRQLFAAVGSGIGAPLIVWGIGATEQEAIVDGYANILSYTDGEAEGTPDGDELVAHRIALSAALVVASADIGTVEWPSNAGAV